QAARLCKADLATRMVYEFPELQGIMGREYARLWGEEEAVCRAIDEHYKPRGGEDGFPSKGPGSFIGIADKLDTIVGYVALGKIPSGSEDPFGLRRAARGVLGTVLEHGYPFELKHLIDEASQLFSPRLPNVNRDMLSMDVWDFLKSRLENLFVAEGFRIDLIQSVLEARKTRQTDGQIGLPVVQTDIADAKNRLKALTAISTEKEFEPLTTTFKRVMNIIPHGILTIMPQVKIGLLQENAEKALHTAYEARQKEIRSLLGRKEYLEALREIAALRPAVDQFFDDVLVMCEDPALRENRLGLLSSIGELFAQVADFRKIIGP
ncbi:MAG: glycine--tRNA ligase subunit beta, partial [Candidatus Tectomicrobia bacterium]|nr:glycine--tRNA ligase subunit beta [Candidatus Tectomicrobia bacterium]